MIEILSSKTKLGVPTYNTFVFLRKYMQHLIGIERNQDKTEAAKEVNYNSIGALKNVGRVTGQSQHVLSQM